MTKFKQTEIGIIPEDWDLTELKTVCVTEGGIQTGPFGSQLHNKDYVERGTPIITVEHLGENIILHENLPKVSDTDKDRLIKYSLREGDIVFSRVGSVDRRAITKKTEEGWLFSGRCLRVRVNKERMKPSFLSYYFGLESFKERVRGHAVGATMPSLNTKLLSEMKVIVPPVNEQVFIAKILSDLDSKIELNRQMNSTLEQMGQALFKRWFVDFEFPDENGNPYKSSGGKMVDSELGGIPDGWAVTFFSKVIDINPNRKLVKGTTSKKVGMANLNAWQSWIDSWQLEEYAAGPKFQNGDTLFARITPSLEHGKTAFVSFLHKSEVAFGSTEFIIFAPKSIASSIYIFHLAKSQHIRDAAIGAMTGSSGRQRVPDPLFDRLLIYVPPKQIIEKFHEALFTVFEKIASNSTQIRNLIDMRNALLPKLMSGEVRVNA